MPACPIPVDESLRQQTLDEMNLLDTPAEHYLDTLVRLTQDLVKVDTVLISLIDQDRQWFKARIGLDATETKRDVSFCGYAILGEDTLLVPDATLDERFADNPLVLGPPYIRFYAGRPLRAGNGQAIGTLCMIDPRPRGMTAAQQANFRDLATLAEGYLQLRSLIQSTRDLRVEMDREQRKALLDPLTQLWNRGALHAFQERECRLARESHAQLGVLYADLDHFKSINDRHGHAGGDQVLRECAQRLRAALRAGAAAPLREPELAQSDLACLQYTGGTTGVAKAAMLSHGNLMANVSQAHAWVAPLVREGEECIVTALPLYHIFALTANCLTFLKIGASNLLIVNPRDISGLIREMSRTPFSAFTGVNTLFNALLNHPQFASLDFSRMRLSMGGGMAVQRAVAERWRAVTGRSLAQAYGLTETSPAVTINPLDVQTFTGSVGLPVPSTDLSVRDDEGRELGIGECGEICVRGPQVTRGYWNRPDETALVMHPDGYLRTGDVGYVDENGYVFLVDRKKDMILVSGFNVYPNEVEDAAALHPGVLEVAAVGVPDERSGEAVKLYVIRRDPALDAETLIAHCRTQLTGYKVPKYVEFRDALPRSSIGKILRRELKPEAAGSAARP